MWIAKIKSWQILQGSIDFRLRKKDSNAFGGIDGVGRERPPIPGSVQEEGLVGVVEGVLMLWKAGLDGLRGSLQL